VALARLRDGRIGDSLVEPTNRSSATVLIDQLDALVERARSEATSAVGIGVPSVVEFETGRVVSSVNVPLADLPLRQLLGARLGVPVFIDNDATVAALAEAHDEQLRPVTENLVMLTVGTGVGGGLVPGGRIYRGATAAPASSVTRSSVSRRGTGRFPRRRRFRSLDRSSPSPPATRSTGSLRRPPSVIRRRRSAACGRAAGRSSARTRCGRLAMAIGPPPRRSRSGASTSESASPMRSTRSIPTRSVIGGGAAPAGELLLQPATRVACGYVLPGLGARTVIRLARHGVRAGVLGAALLAIHELGEA
jgi:glucokinase